MKYAKSHGASLPACPDWLPAERWQAFVDHRRALKRPLTAEAARITLRDLATAREWGHDPIALIEAAISKGWCGCVFPDKHFYPPVVSVASGGGGAPSHDAGSTSSPRVTSGDPRLAEWAAIMADLARPTLAGEVVHGAG